jgi:osmotically inducible protein OsmC
MNNTASYTAIATANGGRKGNVKTNDGILDLRISTPKEFGGLEEGHTNPEQLFAAGWASCFDNAILMVAKGRRVEINSITKVEVTLGPQSNGGVGLSAVIKVQITGVEQEVAQKIVNMAHNVCPYSKATKGNIETEVSLVAEIVNA